MYLSGYKYRLVRDQIFHKALLYDTLFLKYIENKSMKITMCSWT
jgi:hypothetical protein